MILLHENEEEIYGDIRIASLDIVTSVDSPNLEAGVGPGQLRSGWRVTVLPRVTAFFDLASCTWGSRMRCSPTARSWWLARVTASWCRPCGRSATTASTGSSPWSRIWTSKLSSARCRDLSCSPCLAAPYRHSQAGRNSVRMSAVAAETDQRVRVALVGAGVIGPIHAEVIGELADRMELVAVADHKSERAERVAAGRGGKPFSSLSEVLAAVEIDVVTVCTPTGRHAEVAVEALEAGKHVIIEKPAEVTVEKTDEIIAAQRRAGTLVAVISQRRFDPATEVASTPSAAAS